MDVRLRRRYGYGGGHALRRDELMADWDLAVSGETPYKISPL